MILHILCTSLCRNNLELEKQPLVTDDHSSGKYTTDVQQPSDNAQRSAENDSTRTLAEDV